MNVTKLMHQLLERWLTIILESTGAAVTIAFEDDAEERLKSAHTIFARSPDAAGDGRGEPGIGGYLHGYYWRVAPPPMILALKHITDWEAPQRALTYSWRRNWPGRRRCCACKSTRCSRPTS